MTGLPVEKDLKIRENFILQNAQIYLPQIHMKQKLQIHKKAKPEWVRKCWKMSERKKQCK